MRPFPMFLLAGVLGVAAVVLRPWGWVLLWPAGVYAAVGTAYRGGLHGIFGKRPSGTLAPVRTILFLPYLLPSWAIWRFNVWLWERNRCDEVADGLYVGRRLRSDEQLPEGIKMVVDLTAEFSEPSSVRDGVVYRSLPTLDGAAPPADAFERLAEEVAGFDGPVYLHCAVGYGRSATLAAAVLLLRGLARRPREAIEQLRIKRPGVTIGRAQYHVLKRIADRRDASESPQEP